MSESSHIKTCVVRLRNQYGLLTVVCLRAVQSKLVSLDGVSQMYCRMSMESSHVRACAVRLCIPTVPFNVKGSQSHQNWCRQIACLNSTFVFQRSAVVSGLASSDFVLQRKLQSEIAYCREFCAPKTSWQSTNDVCSSYWSTAV